ncbi:head GIN domain-containing protein [soil metagenome]
MSFNRRFFALAATSFIVASTAQAWSWNFGSGERVNGSGEIASETREVGSFDGISLSGGFKVLVRQNSTARLELKADKNLLALIETKVVEGSKGRTLEISPKRGYNLAATITPVITLDMAQLRALSIAGSGDVRVEAMKTASVDASIAGSGDIHFIDLDSDRLGVKVAGSGDVTATGRADKLDVSVAGSGDVKLRGLTAQEVKVSIAGSGDAEVQAIKTLKVSVSGSGDVGYIGSPEISMSVAGSGKVRKISN